MSQHFLKKCENGHVIAQCRCIGSKTETIVPAEECIFCKKEKSMEDFLRFQVGQKVAFKNFDDKTNNATIREVRPSDGWLRLEWDDGFEDFYETQWYHPEDFSLREDA